MAETTRDKIGEQNFRLANKLKANEFSDEKFAADITLSEYEIASILLLVNKALHNNFSTRTAAVKARMNLRDLRDRFERRLKQFNINFSLDS